MDRFRPLQKAINFRPVKGSRTVVVVNDAHQMSDAAANAFLKTLEEPPPGVVIILVTSNPETLPATVRSRCQAVYFPPLPVEVVERHLKEKLSLETSQARFVANLSGGSLGKAISLRSLTLCREMKRFIEELCAVTVENHIAATRRLIDALKEDRSSRQETGIGLAPWGRLWPHRAAPAREVVIRRMNVPLSVR